jgi:hypothetical protein
VNVVINILVYNYSGKVKLVPKHCVTGQSTVLTLVCSADEINESANRMAVLTYLLLNLKLFTLASISC